MKKTIKTALISVYDKTGLEDITALLIRHNIKIYSTGGTQKFLESLGAVVHRVEDLTSYPSILDGRVKTLHPKVFGGILARREANHLDQLEKYEIPEIDLVVVDLYPFEETVAQTKDEARIIEKIDIGGISLIRAAAKNYNDVVVVPSKNEYPILRDMLKKKEASSTSSERKSLALSAFGVSAGYDTAIARYFGGNGSGSRASFAVADQKTPLRYGENPHQDAFYYGDLDLEFDKLSGKSISYNNLVDIDAAIDLIYEFEGLTTTFAILKHTNSCGVATRPDTLEAYQAALAGDPVSAFGGILITNGTVDVNTAEEINKIFYEVLIAPDYEDAALELLKKKKNRILLKRKNKAPSPRRIKSLLGGFIEQARDVKIDRLEDLELKTKIAPTKEAYKQLLFASKICKHLKSNTIVLVNNNQLLGMGCGQTSRVDACKQAIDKATRMGFDLNGAAMASDAFFPFPDCVELAYDAGIRSVIQPGGSINDKLSIDFCDDHEMSMVFTHTRHFKH